MRTLRTALCVLCCALVAAFAAPRGAIAADEGEKVFKEVCSQCHTPQQRPLDNARFTREQWKDQIDKMMGLGAEVPKRKIPALLDYLVRTHGASGDAPATTSSGSGK
jgi:mono/diheme cytochrome c family protein